MSCDTSSVISKKMLCLAFLLIGLGLASAGVHHERIIGGYETDIFDHPYQVAIYHFVKTFLCGGSLVTSQHILTAAHCLPPGTQFPTSQVTLRFGSKDHLNGFTQHPDYWIGHSWYKPQRKDYDVAFFVLKQPNSFSFTPSVMPIELITKEEHPKHGDMLTVAGWGFYSMEEEKVSDYLRAVKLPYLRRDLCRSILTRTSPEFTENMFCAGGGVEKMILSGDSGSAIINKNKKLVGITSWGKGYRPITGYPGFFADVTTPRIRDFIDGVMNGTITKDQAGKWTV